ncbi:MAG: HK97 gp10 family phage protein [Caldilineaceae bacterium]
MTTVRGADDVIRALKRHNEDVDKALGNILLAAASVVAEAIEAKAPGDIRDDIVIDEPQRQKKRMVVAVGPSDEKWYARFLEFGTRGHQVAASVAKALKIDSDTFRKQVTVSGVNAAPFMRPAADESEQKALAAAGSELGKLLR